MMAADGALTDAGYNRNAEMAAAWATLWSSIGGRAPGGLVVPESPLEALITALEEIAAR